MNAPAASDSKAWPDATTSLKLVALAPTLMNLPPEPASDLPPPSAPAAAGDGADLRSLQLRRRVHNRLFGTTVAAVKIGKYDLLECLGAGGMGIVYSALDRELERKVAVKVLSEDMVNPRGRDRLRREARALAKLSHPNVVHVYEVGVCSGQTFIAMEFVEGDTLTRWLDAEPRRWPQVLAKFVAAAQGLMAAHDAGLVHRDFKPDNVLVDTSGRPRVLDFGLAMDAAELSTATGSPIPALPPTGPLSETVSLTTTGSVVGTPAYMAPEQYRGEAADVRTDVFGFCVALYEALYGERPYAGDTVRELADSVIGGRVRRLPPTGVPRRLREVVLRGLRADPAERPQSMAELVTELRRAEPPRHGGRFRHLALAGAVGLGALGIAMASRPSEHAALSVAPAGNVCEAGASKLDRVWGDDARGRVAARFALVNPAAADRAFARIEHGMDDFAGTWVEAWGQACEGALGDPSLESTEQALRSIRCLDTGLAEVAAVVDVLAEATPETLDRALSKPLPLPLVTSCSAGGEASSPALRPIGLLLSRAEASLWSGEADRARELATEAMAEAEAAGATTLAAQARLLVVRAGIDDDALQAVEDLHEAAAQAREAGDLRTEASAWVALVQVAADTDNQAEHPDLIELAPAWVKLAEPLVARLEDEKLGRALAIHRGELAIARGRYDEARTILASVDEQVATLEGDHRAELGHVASLWGRLEREAGNAMLAAEHFERGAQLREVSIGRDHPETLWALLDVAAAGDDPKSAALAAEVYARGIRRNASGSGGAEVAAAALGVLRESERECRERGASCKPSDVPKLLDAEIEKLTVAWGGEVGDRTRRTVERTSTAWSKIVAASTTAHPAKDFTIEVGETIIVVHGDDIIIEGGQPNPAAKPTSKAGKLARKLRDATARLGSLRAQLARAKRRYSSERAKLFRENASVHQLKAPLYAARGEVHRHRAAVHVSVGAVHQLRAEVRAASSRVRSAESRVRMAKAQLARRDAKGPSAARRKAALDAADRALREASKALAAVEARVKPKLEAAQARAEQAKQRSEADVAAAEARVAELERNLGPKIEAAIKRAKELEADSEPKIKEAKAKADAIERELRPKIEQAEREVKRLRSQLRRMQGSKQHKRGLPSL